MRRQSSSFGFFGIFGRSSDLRQLDSALRAADLHPALVPEGVKLAMVNMMKDANGGSFPPADAYGPVADLASYCINGHEAFERSNGKTRTADARHRLQKAAETGQGWDASLVLLMLHASLVDPALRDEFDLEIEDDDR